MVEKNDNTTPGTVKNIIQNDSLQRIAQRAEDSKNKTGIEQKQLPLWADWERAMPTSISRSALFAPIGKGRRKYHINAVIDSRKDVVMTYTGDQLDMGDADVFMQALELAKRHPLGARFTINRAQMLTELDRTYTSENAAGVVRKASIGKSDYAWLDSAMTRLSKGSLTFKFNATKKNKDKGGILHLVGEWLWDNDSNAYVVSIAPEIHKLFESFSRIYLNKHLALPKSDQLAKWLHLYVAGCDKNTLTKIGLDHLRAYSGNKHRRMDHFATSMKRSMQALEVTGIIAAGWFIRANDRMLGFTRII